MPGFNLSHVIRYLNLGFPCFSLQHGAWILPHLCHECFLPYPSQFIQQLLQSSTPYTLRDMTIAIHNLFLYHIGRIR